MNNKVTRIKEITDIAYHFAIRDKDVEAKIENRYGEYTKSEMTMRLLGSILSYKNSDGTIDVVLGEYEFFTIDYSGFGVYNLKIYNRWGGIIYESRDKSQHWDGKFNNNNASAGTYFYILTIDEKIHKGFLNLFR